MFTLARKHPFSIMRTSELLIARIACLVRCYRVIVNSGSGFFGVSLMKKKIAVFISLFVFNAPWISVWWYVTRLPEASPSNVPILFLLLIIGLVGLIVIPCVLVRDLFRRRWFLIATLACINLYWMLSWVDAYADSNSDSAAYQILRCVIPARMIIYSTLILLGYWVCGQLLNLFKLYSKNSS